MNLAALKSTADDDDEDGDDEGDDDTRNDDDNDDETGNGDDDDGDEEDEGDDDDDDEETQRSRRRRRRRRQRRRRRRERRRGRAKWMRCRSNNYVHTSDTFLPCSNFQASLSNGRRQTMPHDDPNRGRELLSSSLMPKAAAECRTAECRVLLGIRRHLAGRTLIKNDKKLDETSPLP